MVFASIQEKASSRIFYFEERLFEIQRPIDRPYVLVNNDTRYF